MKPHYWHDTDEMIYPEKWSPEFETDAAIDYLEHRDKSRPFNLFISWNPPHPPYDLVPEKYMKLYEDTEIPFRENVPEEWRKDEEYQKKRREYFAAVSGLDENFGRLMDYLKETGLMEETLIVLQQITEIVWVPMDAMERTSGMKNPSGFRCISMGQAFRQGKATYCLPVRIICQRCFSCLEQRFRIR